MNNGNNNVVNVKKYFIYIYNHKKKFTIIGSVYAVAFSMRLPVRT